VLHGSSGIRSISLFDAANYRTRIAAEISDWEAGLVLGRDVCADICQGQSAGLDGLDRIEQFAIGATHLALQDAMLSAEAANPARVGICMGSGLGGLFFAERGLANLIRTSPYSPRGVSPMTVPQVDPNASTCRIAMRWGITGPQFTISTACSSSAHALGQALLLLRAGRVDVVLAGGAEAPISPLTFAGFDQLRAMSVRNEDPRSACRPFSRDRDGFVMGEGAAVLVLETEEHAHRRGANPYAEFAGYGASGGGYHLVAPDPTGRDAAAAMEQAIRDAALQPHQIGAINAHGTATSLNDAAESQAIRRVFGKHGERIPVNATKAITGHLLGASGALEAALSVLTVRTGQLPPILTYAIEPDHACRLNLITTGGISCQPQAVLSNSFGFGNNNAALVFKRLSI
jgi:3-oxoacyl-[acyl-carrier-protein] synthase II